MFLIKVGLTYDLRSDYTAEGFTDEETAEFDKIETVEAIETALHAAGYLTDRIGNIKSLAKRLIAGEKWDIVFNIAEGMYGVAREGQVPALLDAYNIPYTFSDTLIMALTLHKGFTKSVIRDIGVPTADFAVVEKIEDISKIRFGYPLFAKPAAEGNGKGISSDSIIKNKAELVFTCSYLLKKFNGPVIVEEFLPGREFTVGIIGTGDNARAVGTIEVVSTEKGDQNVYTYENKQNCHEFCEYILIKGDIAEKCEKVALDAWKGLGCRDAGRIDLRYDAKGVPNFLEVNPVAGLNPIDSDLPIICSKIGLPYNDLIKQIMDSAVKRIK